MAYTNFKPTIWSKQVQMDLAKLMVFREICNTNFQGEAGRGKTVKIVGISKPTVKTYAPGTAIAAAETPADTAVALSQITQTGAPDLAQNITPTWTSKRDEVPNLQFPTDAKENGYALNNGVTKFRIYMWVEGQDIDAENFASGSYLEYNLSFSLDPYRAAQGG